MLRSIHIENYTLISHLSIDFHSGFSVITGETGAGKSMLIGALSFLLGQRTDVNVVKDKSKKTIVEAIFTIENPELYHIFDQLDLDREEECIVRREITPQGKSRSFVNDTPIAVSDLKKIATYLLDIHAQHSNILLQKQDFQLLVIDQYANIENDLKKYQTLFNDYKQTLAYFQELKEKHKNQDITYIDFLYQEIAVLHLQHGEEDDLTEKLHQLTHAQDIQVVLNETSHLLSEHEINAIDLITACKRKLETIEKYGDIYSNILHRINSQIIELTDISNEIGQLAQLAVYDENEMQYVSDRLNAINRLEQKHQVNSIEQLLAIADNLKLQIDNLSNYQLTEEKILRQIAQQKSQLQQVAEQISDKRKKVLPEIENSLKKQMQAMNLSSANIEIVIEPTDFTIFGIDKPTFLFNANPGMPMQPIEKIASGGELSRLMLAIKALIIKKEVLPTIIFDEIDTGVSGEVSAKMAKVMQSISQYCQVIAITHLPQIAAKANYHYLIFKQINNENTKTHIELLNENERIYELAKMISNEQVTDSSLAAAKNLLNS